MKKVKLVIPCPDFMTIVTGLGQEVYLVICTRVIVHKTLPTYVSHVSRVLSFLLFPVLPNYLHLKFSQLGKCDPRSRIL
jgi:hypothetical protein